MANPKHVKIVRKGFKAFTTWRNKNLDIHLDLSGADLREIVLPTADLTNADLSDTDLTHAFLSCADLSLANMQRAELSHAILRGTKVVGADLTDANLADSCLQGTDMSDANLDRADLSRADLFLANLTGAKLNATRLSGAVLHSTIIINANLADAIDLKEIVHERPSWIGIDTLFNAQGRIPEEFLHGCGVPHELIVQLPAIIGSMEPIQFYSCFISYSSDDEAFVRRLYTRLKAEKLRVWFAPEDMKGGEKSGDQIDTAIQVHDRLLLVLSEMSMNSEWVQREIERAREKEKQTGRNVLFPIALATFEKIRAWKCLDVDSGEDLGKKVREYHIPDFSRWKQEDEFEKAFADLMRDLRAKAER